MIDQEKCIENLTRFNRFLEEGIADFDKRHSRGFQALFSLPTIGKLESGGFLDEDTASILRDMLKQKKGILITGDLTGRLMLFSVLANEISGQSRLVTVESQERALFDIKEAENTVRIFQGFRDGYPEYREADLVRTAIRMRPSWIAVEQITDYETINHLTSLLPHPGILASTFGFSVRQALEHIGNIALDTCPEQFSAYGGQLASLTDYVIHVNRDEQNNYRIMEITEVHGYDAQRQEFMLEPIFSAEELLTGQRTEDEEKGVMPEQEEQERQEKQEEQTDRERQKEEKKEKAVDAAKAVTAAAVLSAGRHR